MIDVQRTTDGDFAICVAPDAWQLFLSFPDRLEELLLDPEQNHDVIRRLFPAAYKNAEHEAEYRRLLGKDLLERKTEGLQTFRATVSGARKRRIAVARPGGKPRREIWREILVPEEKFDSWLAFINDFRLMLGVQLDIQEDGWSDELELSHPQAEEFALLHLLSWLEEKLISATDLGSNTDDPT